MRRLKRLEAYVERLKGKLRHWLESLSPKARLRLVVLAFALFAICCLYMIGSAIIGFGSGGKGADIGHIEILDLPKKQEVINLYNNIENGEGTEREHSEQGNSGFKE